MNEQKLDTLEWLRKNSKDTINIAVAESHLDSLAEEAKDAAPPHAILPTSLNLQKVGEITFTSTIDPEKRTVEILPSQDDFDKTALVLTYAFQSLAPIKGFDAPEVVLKLGGVVLVDKVSTFDFSETDSYDLNITIRYQVDNDGSDSEYIERGNMVLTLTLLEAEEEEDEE